MGRFNNNHIYVCDGGGDGGRGRGGRDGYGVLLKVKVNLRLQAPLLQRRQKLTPR